MVVPQAGSPGGGRVRHSSGPSDVWKCIVSNDPPFNPHVPPHCHTLAPVSGCCNACTSAMICGVKSVENRRENGFRVAFTSTAIAHE